MEHIETEEAAILRAKEDPQEFSLLYEKYFKRIFLFILHRMGEKDIAGDLTQEVFIKALQGSKKYELRGLLFSSWLFRIAINECNEYSRRKKKIRVVTLEERSVQHLAEELSLEAFPDEIKNKLAYVIQRLKPLEVSIIELRFFENKSFREVGEILDLTEVNAKIRTYRIIDKMKEILVK